MMNVIDPSVVDEADPLQTDESLSAFNAANGFKTPPESSSYAPDFLAKYRTAQRARVERIDAMAKALIARKAEARARLKAARSRPDAILAAYSPIFQVWRTDADPRCFDLTIEPSDRAYGSLWGANPIASNYGSVGSGRSLHAGKLAFELVRAVIQREHGGVRPRHHATDADDRIHGRQQRLPERCGRDLCRYWQ